MRNQMNCIAIVALVVATFTPGSVRAESKDKDIVATAVSAGSFNTLAQALQAADLVSALQGEGPFTVFAPTDDAFAKLPEGTVATLLKPENKQQLVDVLTFHVVKGKVTADEVVKLSGAKSLNGQQIDIRVDDGKVQVDGAQVVTTDVLCSNGVIHVIDQVIMPATENIPATAEKSGNFQTLLAAVTAAELAEVLSGEGPFTVFAPTDDAFAKLPEGTVETLLKPENKSKLVEILKLHVVPGRVYSTDAVSAGTAKTLQGEAIVIEVHDNVAKVNDAKLVATDIDASNGVIHVIETVLLPSEKGQAATQLERSTGKTASHHQTSYNSPCSATAQ